MKEASKFTHITNKLDKIFFNLNCLYIDKNYNIHLLVISTVRIAHGFICFRFAYLLFPYAYRKFNRLLKNPFKSK